MRIIDDDDAWVHETYEELGASSCMKIVTCVLFSQPVKEVMGLLKSNGQSDK